MTGYALPPWPQFLSSQSYNMTLQPRDPVCFIVSAFVHHSHKVQHLPDLPRKGCVAAAVLFKFKKRRRSNKLHQHKILTSTPGKGICQLSDDGLLERNVIYCSAIYSYRKKLIITPLVMWNPKRRRAKIHFGSWPIAWIKVFFFLKGIIIFSPSHAAQSLKSEFEY